MARRAKVGRWLAVLGLLGGLVAIGLLVWSGQSVEDGSSTARVGPTVGYEPLKPTEGASGEGVATLPAGVEGIKTPTSLENLKLSPDRYGLIVTGLAKQPEAGQATAIRQMLETSGANWWYSYLPQHPALNNKAARQVYMVRVWGRLPVAENLKYWLDFIRQTGHFAQPTYWLFGNEPNVSGQDNTSPELYADALFEFSKAVRTADPHATIIGPNVLNWDQTCQACPGFTSGHAWTDRMRTVYHARYGTEPPLDAWSLHTYSLNWNKLPLVDQPQDANQLQSFRAYLDSIPALLGRPIWLSEFGVVWGYEGIDWQQNASGGWTALPRGAFRTDLLEQYLNDSLNWIEANADRLRIERWFLFTSLGEPEAFSPNQLTGISLFEQSSGTLSLTNFGRLYFARFKKDFPITRVTP